MLGFKFWVKPRPVYPTLIALEWYSPFIHLWPLWGKPYWSAPAVHRVSGPPNGIWERIFITVGLLMLMAHGVVSSMVGRGPKVLGLDVTTCRLAASGFWHVGGKPSIQEHSSRI